MGRTSTNTKGPDCGASQEGGGEATAPFTAVRIFLQRVSVKVRQDQGGTYTGFDHGCGARNWPGCRFAPASAREALTLMEIDSGGLADAAKALTPLAKVEIVVGSVARNKDCRRAADCAALVHAMADAASRQAPSTPRCCGSRLLLPRAGRRVGGHKGSASARTGGECQGARRSGCVSGVLRRLFHHRRGRADRRRRYRAPRQLPQDRSPWRKAPSARDDDESLTQPRRDSPAPTRRDCAPLASLRRAPRPRGRAAAKPGLARRGGGKPYAHRDLRVRAGPFDRPLSDASAKFFGERESIGAHDIGQQQREFFASHSG